MLSIDRSFFGGLGFGLTACDPSTVDPGSLPDDSDLLLDRLEYWVVNKDICRNPEIGDELSFHLTESGLWIDIFMASQIWNNIAIGCGLVIQARWLCCFF